MNARISRASQVVKDYCIGAWRRYQKAPILGKAFVWFLILFHVALVTVIVKFGASGIAQYLYDLSQQLRKLRFGWLLLASVIAVTSLPPLVGWSTSISLCGFAYGLKGWFVAAGGAVVGAALSFLILRFFFTKRIKSWTKTNQKWQALEAVIRSRGLPLIILIRLCPLPPWVYANLLFASIETVSFFQFMVATLCYTPKLMFAVWVGSRVAMLSDGEQRGEMDTTAKIVNSLSIALGIALGVGTGWLIYRLTQEQIRKTPSCSSEVDEAAAEAFEHAGRDLEEPLIRAFSNESYRDDPEEGAELFPDELPAAQVDYGTRKDSPRTIPRDTN